MPSARALAERRGVAQRVTLYPSNFFREVPAGAELYVLKNILHDWDDEGCRALLVNVRRAMAPGQSVVVVEQRLDRTGGNSLATFSDVQMLLVCRGLERSISEIQGLLCRAGFDSARTFHHPVLTLMEGRAI
jgi:hypothetical protein